MSERLRTALFSFMATCAVGTILSADELRSSIRLLQLGDWGGNEKDPYTTPSQLDTAVGMAVIGEELAIQYVLALGDNFYHMGINGTCESPRFDATWNDVYTAPSLMVPWLVNAGNHDHNGNVSAQIAYTELSDRWLFPSLYHKRTLYSEDGSLSLDVILMDTTTYTGVNSGTDYPADPVDPEQQAWIEQALRYSTADYIILGSHYPVYSVCEHGNVLTMVNHIKPLLEKYNAHLMSGHDHCAEHFVVNDISYWLNGVGHGCCYNAPNMDTAPPGALRYLLSNENMTSQIDDDGIEVGVNGTVGGFTSIYITKQNMTVKYHNQNGTLLYSSYVLPRYLGGDDTDNSLPVMDVVFICVGGAVLSIVFVLGLYYFVYKRRQSLLNVSTADEDSKLAENPLTHPVRASDNNNSNTEPLLAEEST